MKYFVHWVEYGSFSEVKECDSIVQAKEFTDKLVSTGKNITCIRVIKGTELKVIIAIVNDQIKYYIGE